MGLKFKWNSYIRFIDAVKRHGSVCSSYSVLSLNSVRSDQKWNLAVWTGAVQSSHSSLGIVKSRLGDPLENLFTTLYPLWSSFEILFDFNRICSTASKNSDFRNLISKKISDGSELHRAKFKSWSWDRHGDGKKSCLLKTFLHQFIFLLFVRKMLWMNTKDQIDYLGFKTI